ncbi:hypothetical protein [Geminicoccus harenae]|uniref:hypothetical protein n=1 Tax=Geminicoccus harenae TaxID=2498453 RepID=UPI00168A59EF|nr:hypothetical protein [Geminicoccus harenae]
MLAALAFLSGMVLAGYGVGRWYREREAVMLAEISHHFERRQKQMLARIDEGDQALLAAYRELDRLEGQLEAGLRELGEARSELAETVADKQRLENMLYGQPQPMLRKLAAPAPRERRDWPLRHAQQAS